MSRETYTTNLVPNASRAQVSHSSNFYITFNTRGTSTFTVDSIAAANGDAGDTVVVHLDNSNGDVREMTVEVENAARMYYNVGLSIPVPENGWVHILLEQYGCDVYWDYASGEFPFGYTGNGTSSYVEAYDLVFTAEYEYVPKWMIDSQNDGYPYPIGTDPTEFTEFAKDEFGYPKNWGVWKLDDNNDGYPWPTGYEDYIVRGLPVKIMSQDKTHWIIASVGVFTDEKIINAYVKLIGDDEDADNGYAVDPEQVFATTDST